MQNEHWDNAAADCYTNKAGKGQVRWIRLRGSIRIDVQETVAGAVTEGDSVRYGDSWVSATTRSNDRCKKPSEPRETNLCLRGMFKETRCQSVKRLVEDLINSRGWVIAAVIGLDELSTRRSLMEQEIQGEDVTSL